MADFSFTQHDTHPPLEAVLTDLDGPIDLTTATKVLLLLKGQKRTSPASVAGECLIVDALAGEVRYEWAPEDTAVADLYNGLFEIQWGDGSESSVPNKGYFYVEFQPDLNSA